MGLYEITKGYSRERERAGSTEKGLSSGESDNKRSGR